VNLAKVVPKPEPLILTPEGDRGVDGEGPASLVSRRSTVFDCRATVERLSSGAIADWCLLPLAVPPPRQVSLGPARVVLVVGDVVEEHQPRPHRVAEVDDVQAGRGLVEAISVPAGIEAEQAGQDQPQSGFVRDYEHRLVGGGVGDDSRTTGSARASTATPDSPPSGAKVKGSASQVRYSSGWRCSTSARVSPSQWPWLISRNPSR
jgi:hypothetical protein